MSGTKHDQGKPQMHLLPTEALEEMAKVLMFGAEKYDPWNWTEGFDWSRLYDATIRHMNAFQRGEDLDQESGLPHLAHAGCAMMFLLMHYKKGLGKDDRFIF